MSRNLTDTLCSICSCAEVKLDEPPRPITTDEAGVYYDSHKGLIVANATCKLCDAKYLAWVRWPGGDRFWNDERRIEEFGFCDLSFRSTFNDEPGPADLPTPEVLKRLHERTFEVQIQATKLHIRSLLDTLTDLQRSALNDEPYWESYRR